MAARSTGVAQLAHVARPLGGAQRLAGLVGEAGERLAGAARRLAQEQLGEEQHILAARAQRWQVQLGHREAEVEVLAKAAGSEVVLERSVGRGHDAHRHLDRRVRAHRVELAVLEDAQQLGLRGAAEVAELVEEQRAAVGHARSLPRRARARR
jgi:hypothetical protein